jgi:2-methylcitrate dehydratase PrpD
MSDETLSHALARWVCALDFDAAPPSARQTARKALINSLGTAIGAHGLDDVRKARDAVLAEEGLAGRCTVLVGGERLPAQHATFLNGVLMNTLGQEETHITSGTHPAETTIPVVLALAEQLGSSGRDVLEAILAGIEVTVRVASMALTPAVKFDNCEAPAVYGTVGAAAAAAKLAKLDLEQTTNCIGLGANLAAGLSECVKVGTSEYHFTVAHASVHAAMALQLARQGAVAAPTAFEGDGGFYQLFGASDRAALAQHDVVGDVCSPLGRVWEIEEMIFKPYPVNFFNQSPIDGARALREQGALSADDVASVVLEIGTLAAASGGPNRPPYRSRESVLGATGFCVAAMLARGDVQLAETNAYDAPDILGILERTEIRLVEGLMTARVEVTTIDGRTLRFDHDADGRDYRLPEPDIHAIFLEAAGNALDDASARRLLDALATVEQVGDFREVVALTVQRVPA